MISDSNWAGSEGRDLNIESAPNNIRLMNDTQLKGLFFDAIRACHINAIKNILQVNRSLVTAKMFGYEGTDVYEAIKNSKTHRCYTYSGQERDGFFYPLHVAAEAGHKRLTLLLVKAGADVDQPDYRGDLAEAKCNGDSQHAFFELRGMSFESRERFEGKLDREGRRAGNGVLYFKPEGYAAIEKVLFRGNFKFGLFHGHGTLYHEGLDAMRYAGRFKLGEMHGRGLEFDRHGHKIYTGNFRHNQRDGRGEEFSENILVYKGEFGKNTRHGFGVAIFGENHRYIGRFENNMMAGVGIYCHPTNDRFEGMFYNNKPDGFGSFYEAEQVGKQEMASHAMWQKGKKVKEMTTSFVPNVIDLPDDRSQTLLTAISAEEDKIMKDLELEAAENESEDGSYLMNESKDASDSRQNTHGLKSSNESLVATDWKNILAKYCRLTPEECKSIGLEVNEEVKAFVKDLDDSKEGDEADEAVKEEREDISSDLNGVHFIDYTTLFVAYLYIYSAAKVFDSRLASTQLDESAPDFEVVQNIVIDAVETYNDLWEAEFRAQESEKTHETDGDKDKKATVEQKRQIFMTEREKREEELKRQRTELAAKKGTGVLDHARDLRIRELVINGLQEELLKLIVRDGQGTGSAQEVIDLTAQFSGSNSINDRFGFLNDSPNPNPKSVDNESNEPNQFAAELLHIIRTSTSICSTNI